MNNDNSVERYSPEPIKDIQGPETWVVIPAYNESGRLAQTLEQVVRPDWNIVVVDDGSLDETASIASQFPVWVLQHPINCGQGAALKTGIDFAIERGAEVVVTFDADGQHDPNQIPHLVAPIANDEADVSLGSRFKGEAINMPWTRRLTLHAAILFTRFTTGLVISDAHNGFRAFSRLAAQTIKIQQSQMAHASEILEEIARHKLRYVEVPVTVTYRQETLEKGQSSLGAFRITGHLLAGRIWK